MTKVMSLRKQVLVLAVGLLSRDTVTYACIQWHLGMVQNGKYIIVKEVKSEE